MHKGWVLQRVSLGALSDIMVVLWMRQSIFTFSYHLSTYQTQGSYHMSQWIFHFIAAFDILYYVLHFSKWEYLYLCSCDKFNLTVVQSFPTWGSGPQVTGP